MIALESLRVIQATLQAYYGLEHGPDVCDFVSFQDARESLLLRENADSLELSLVLPEAGSPLVSNATGPLGECNDTSLQLIEGVSHFVYIVERARTELPATQLELELQAEVDKFVFFALSGDAFSGALSGDVDRERADLRERLYENVRFLHPAGTELGDRYRMASSLAARFVARLNVNLTAPPAQRQLRRFYRLGQTEKLSMAAAA